MRITEQDRRVLELAADGLTNREIAERLRMSSGGVDKAFWTMYRRLDIAGTVEPCEQRHEAIRQYLSGEAFE
jgi:DNA-binding NarL/FixJ family response regulator